MSTKLDEKTAAQAADRAIATYEVLLEDDDKIVTHWVLGPRAQTGWHRHECDYMAIQLSHGKLLFELADGTTREIDYTPGASLMVQAPMEHNAINIGDVDVVALEVEFKR
jgi:mannose-6-phosphate isomerase-like protein (cupin superfamily)